MQAVIAMGEHDSIHDFARAAAAAARSARIRTWVLRLAGAAALWLAAWIKGWEASLVYAPRARKLEARIGRLEDAGVGMSELDALDTIQRADRDRLSAHIDAEHKLEVERWRAWLRLMVHASRLESAVREYDADVSSGYPPHIAADRAARYSRPPGR